MVNPEDRFSRDETHLFLHRSPDGQTPGGTQAVMIIGNNNVFEVGSCILVLLTNTFTPGGPIILFDGAIIA